MITNLICTVTVCLVTNTREVYPTRMVYDADATTKADIDTGIWGNCIMRRITYPDPPKQKDVITEVDKITHYSTQIDANGISTTEIVSMSTNHFVFVQNWVKSEGFVTNPAIFDW